MVNSKKGGSNGKRPFHRIKQLQELSGNATKVCSQLDFGTQCMNRTSTEHLRADER